MNILIISGGRTCSQLARLLMAQKHSVMVIENRPSVLEKLHQEVPTECVIQGDYFDLAVLERAGIKEANILVAGTDDDEANLFLCYMAGSRYQVPRKIARVNNPKHAWLFDKSFDVDYALNQAELLAMMIEEEISTGHMMVLMKLGRGNFSLLKATVPEGAPAVGMKMKDLSFDCVIAAIIRDGEVVPPHGETEFMTGDIVMALVDRENEMKLGEIFASMQATRR